MKASVLEQETEHPPSAGTPVDFKLVKRKASLLQFLRDPLAFFRAISRHDGSLTHISLGGRDFFILSDPSLIRDILSTRGVLFEKFPQGNPKQKIFGQGLLTSEGAAQKQQRRMLLPAFHRDRLQNYADHMVASVESLVTSWQEKATIDVAHEMNEVTLEIIGRTLLGACDTQDAHAIGKHLHTMLNLANRFVVPWGDWLMKLPVPSTLRYRTASASLDKIVFGLIKLARSQPPSGSLVHLLLESTRADGTALNDREIRDEIVTMIVAGHETVAVGLTWSLYLLASHPQLQENLAARVAEVLGSRSPTADDFPRLEFLQHAFSESLRLHPPIWLLGRRSLQNYSFRNFHAPKGAIFLVCMADLHRRETFFTNPDSFIPDRWAAPDWPTYAFIPFGGGDRRCIGERFAWMEAVLILASLLKRWRFTPTTNQPPETAAKLTLHPRGPLWLNVTPRSTEP